MPYINRDERYGINVAVDSLVDAIFDDATFDNMDKVVPVGRLNYALTRLCHMLLIEGDLSYSRLSAVHAALRDADRELYRQVTAPYEDLKKGENGAVSSLDGPDLQKLCDAYPFGDDDS